MGAFAAQAMEDDFSILYGTPPGNLVREGVVVKGRPVKINNFMAPVTDEMMVVFDIYLKPRLAFSGLDLGDETMLFKGTQGSVNGIDG